MNIPTIKELSTLFQFPETVHEILTLDIEEVIKKYEPARARVNECYNRPDDADIRLHAINHIEQFYGVEGFPITEDAVRSSDFVDYLNSGDTYSLTLLHHRGKYWLGSYGDAYEQYTENN